MSLPKPSINDGTSRDPIDRMAAIGMSKGEKFDSTVRLKNPHWSSCPSILPLDHFSYTQIDLRGKTIGRFVVVGLLQECSSRKKKNNPARWVVRCSCGDYETRSSRSIRNPSNFGDRCMKCREVAFLKRDWAFKVKGEELDQRKL